MQRSRQQDHQELLSQPRRADDPALRCAVGQLTLVEHCLCPLDGRKTLQPNFVHETNYLYSHHRNRKRASVRVSCPGGLTAEDEFYLWGLLALTLEQRRPTPSLHATRHYCLRQLGKIDSRRRGGRQYEQFTQSLERLSQVSYQNDAFYDPLRREHRRVSFGFLSYTLPRDRESSRAWQIVWDPVFFEFCLAARSLLTFEFQIYRDLDGASRRLFLFLHKLFWRYRRTPPLQVRELGVCALGFSATLTAAELMSRIGRCADRLAGHQVVARRRDGWFRRKAKGCYEVRFSRGKYFDSPRPQFATSISSESPLVDPLKSIGFNPNEIGRILRQFSEPIVRQWSDVTLAAIEHKGRAFFKRSPQAFFLHYAQQAAQGASTPPDWWLDLKKAEMRVQSGFGAQSRDSSRSGGLAAASDIMEQLVSGGALKLRAANQK